MATMPFTLLGYSQWKRYCMLQLDSSQNSNLGPAGIVLLGKTQCIFPHEIKMYFYTDLPAMNMSLHAMLSISIFNLIKRTKLGSGNLLASRFQWKLDLKTIHYVNSRKLFHRLHLAGLVTNLKMADGSIKYLLDWSALISEINTLQITSVWTVIKQSQSSPGSE